MKPALTAKEWAEYLNPENSDWAPLMYRDMSDHVAAADRIEALLPPEEG